MTCTAVPGEGPEQQARIDARAKRAWGRFSQAAVSSFAFVESAGLLHAWSLLRDGLGLKRAAAPAEPPPHPVAALPLADRIATAEAVLRAMSMTAGFAPLVLLAGHGANVVNNPHASALHCGACGGHQGDVSARLLAGLLNDAEVRAGLLPRGIEIPADTLFVGALHDTTTDAVTLYAADHASPAHAGALRQAEAWLARPARWRGRSAPCACRGANSRRGGRRARSWTGRRRGRNGASRAAAPSSPRRAARRWAATSAGGPSCTTTTGRRTAASACWS